MQSQVFGRFELLEQIAESGNSYVYRARPTQGGDDVALKIAKRPLSYAEARLGRYGTEAKMAAELTHPGICRVLSIGKEDDHPYVVMELLRGVSLLDRIRTEGRVPPTDLVRIVRQAGEAVAFAHERGVVHRDIKPDNLMLTADGAVKVLDFGIARRGATAQEGQAIGTPAYMSPEQASGGVVDERTDVYSLGAVLYHALSGRPPYEGADLQALLREVAERPPRPLDRDVPGPLRKVVAKAMARDVNQRYQTVAAMLKDLSGEAAAAPGGDSHIPWLAVGVGVAAVVAAIVLAVLGGAL